MTVAPNIVMILVDDMGWRDAGCFGSSFYETPNIDQLASEGMSFTNAYAACPVCSPTRASLMTGQYPARIGVTNYINDKGYSQKGKLIDTPYIDHLPLPLTSLASALKEGDYQTWHIGKWHLGNAPYYPDQQGFDVNIGGCHLGHPWTGYFSPYNIPTLQDGPDGEYLTDRLTDEGIQLISQRDPEKPFFLNLWYYTVHNPIQAPKEFVQKFKQKAVELGLDNLNPFHVGDFFPVEMKNNKRIMRRMIQSNPYYAAMIYALDQNIGRLMTVIRNSDIAENTLVIFTSDNGGLSTSEGSPTSNKPLNEGKGWMYEGGTREPMIAWWPSTIESSSKCHTPITSPDFYPTFVSLAGLQLSKSQICDGKSFVPLLQGEQLDNNRSIFWHYPHYGNQGGTPGTSIRKGNYKLIHFYENNRDELYNLSTDIAEEFEISKQFPKITTELRNELDNWLQEIEGLIPENNPEYDGFADNREEKDIFPMIKYDLETPLGVLLYDLEARGLLKELLEIETDTGCNFIIANNGNNLLQLSDKIDLPLEELEEKLRHIFNRRNR